jgi:hypothetical protein
VVEHRGQQVVERGDVRAETAVDHVPRDAHALGGHHDEAAPLGLVLHDRQGVHRVRRRPVQQHHDRHRTVADPGRQRRAAMFGERPRPPGLAGIGDPGEADVDGKQVIGEASDLQGPALVAGVAVRAADE